MMLGGTVTVNEDETHAGSGLALALYLGRKPTLADALASLDPEPMLAPLRPDIDKADNAEKKAKMLVGLKDARLAVLRGLADDCNAFGPAIVGYIQAHAEVSLAGVTAAIETSVSVGRLPAPVVPLAPIEGPEELVALPVTGESGATALGVK